MHTPSFLALLFTSAAQLPAPVVTPPPGGPDTSTLDGAVPVEARLWWRDVDGDGDEDVVAIQAEGRVSLLLQEAPGEFIDRTLELGLEGVSGATLASWCDVDGDGRLDLFLGLGARPAALWRDVGSGLQAVPLRLAEGQAELWVAWSDLDGDALPELLVETSRGDLAFRNLGGFVLEPLALPLPEGTLVDVLEELAVTPGAGISWKHGAASGLAGATRAEGSSARSTTEDAPVQPPTGTASGLNSVVSGSADAAPPAAPADPAAQSCLESLRDQATQACVEVSSTPQLGTLYPLGTEFNIDPSGRVGFGTTTPGARVHVMVPSGTGVHAAGGEIGVRGDATTGGGTGARYGGYFTATGGSNNNGVYGFGGIGLRGTGTSIGAYADTSSSAGVGAFGSANAAGGNTVGVRGSAASTAGTGVRGEAVATTGVTTGVEALVVSPDGVALRATNPDASFTGRAILAQVTDPLSGATVVESVHAGTGGHAVLARATNLIGGTFGVLGSSRSESGAGILGASSPADEIWYIPGSGVSGSTEVAGSVGTFGLANHEDAYAGVLGVSSAGGSAPGVAGETTSSYTNWGADEVATGVRGTTTHTASSDTVGVWGESVPRPNWGLGGYFEGGYIGVQGVADVAPAGIGSRFGGHFTATGEVATGALAEATGSLAAFGQVVVANGPAAIVTGVDVHSDGTVLSGRSASDDPGVPGLDVAMVSNQGVNAVAIVGYSETQPNFGTGGRFEGGYIGLIGSSDLIGSGSRYGAAFSASGGADGNYGVQVAASGANATGIYAYGQTRAGLFAGDVDVIGTLSKSSGTFKIDHPLEPETKYLYHSFVESPEMINVYTGNVTTDAQGWAVVELPKWFEALNHDFRYQLTPIGQFAQAIVAEKVRDNQFAIRTDRPGVEVSWTLTGVRQDAYARANPVEVEVSKPADEQGTYLHPEAFGLGPERALGYARRQESAERLRLQDQALSEGRVQRAAIAEKQREGRALRASTPATATPRPYREPVSEAKIVPVRPGGASEAD